MIDPNFLPEALPPQRVAAAIGLISDTHMPQRCLALPEALFALFAGADLLLHAGDVGELWVLDQLSRIAPVVAVHGNDDTRMAQRELPYQQTVTVAGQRILLWHSHYPDRVDEMESRRDNALVPKLARSVARAKRAGARVAVFGHWHIPLVYQADGVLVINPGSLAAGNAITRLLRQTVAWLFVRDDGVPFVCHVDLAQPDRPFVPQIDWAAGFQLAHNQFNASMLATELKPHMPYLEEQMVDLGYERALQPILRVAHRCWAGQQSLITLADWQAEVAHDPDLPPQIKDRYLGILRSLEEK
jgi:putative phosphoesterase